MTPSPPATITTVAPPPWTCRCEAYWLVCYGTSKTLPAHVYDPLEESAFEDASTTGKFVGGVGMMQIVRYTNSPVGDYDELLIVPGYFEVPGTKKTHCRVTRIYVSQRETCYWGRKNWGIPKHLARFVFSSPVTAPAASGAGNPLKVDVFPPDEGEGGGGNKAFFSATFQPFRWTPSVPFSTKLMPWLGLDVHLVQPPLPATSAAADEEEVTSSEHWFKILPELFSPRARGMHVDLHVPRRLHGDIQKGERGRGREGEGETESLLNGNDIASWWPAVQPWSVGMWLEDATLTFPEPEILG